MSHCLLILLQNSVLSDLHTYGQYYKTIFCYTIDIKLWQYFDALRHICTCHKGLGHFHVKGANLQVQTHFVSKITRIRILLHGKISFAVLVISLSLFLSQSLKFVSIIAAVQLLWGKMDSLTALQNSIFEATLDQKLKRLRTCENKNLIQRVYIGVTTIGRSTFD